MGSDLASVKPGSDGPDRHSDAPNRGVRQNWIGCAVCAEHGRGERRASCGSGGAAQIVLQQPAQFLLAADVRQGQGDRLSLRKQPGEWIVVQALVRTAPLIPLDVGSENVSRVVFTKHNGKFRPDTHETRNRTHPGANDIEDGSVHGSLRGIRFTDEDRVTPARRAQAANFQQVGSGLTMTTWASCSALLSQALRTFL